MDLSDSTKNPREKIQNIDIQEALDYTGFGKFNVFLIIVCGICLMGVNNESYIIGYILPSAECDLQLDSVTKGILSSVHFIGIISSAFIWGYISDTKGRKNILMVNLMLAALCSIAVLFVNSFWELTLLRFLNGIFISGPSSITFAYLGEFHNKKYRSKAIALGSVFIAFALISLPGLGWLILPQQFLIEFYRFKFNSWKLYMAINSIPNCVSAIMLWKIPESPTFLYNKGHEAKSLDILSEIYASNTNNSKYNFPVVKLKQNLLVHNENQPQNILKSIWTQIKPLFVPPVLKYTVAACCMQAGVFAVSSGLYLWYPDIIKQLSKVNNGNHGVTVCKALANLNEKPNLGCDENLDNKIFIQNIIIGGVYLTGYSCWSVIVNIIGNRNYFVICMASSGIALFLVNLISQTFIVDGLFVILLVLSGICVSVISAMVVDSIPTSYCGMAICLTLMSGRLGSIVSSFLVGLLLEWNCFQTFFIYGFIPIGCLLISFTFTSSKPQAMF